MVWEPEVGALLEVRRWVGGWLDIVFEVQWEGVAEMGVGNQAVV